LPLPPQLIFAGNDTGNGEVKKAPPAKPAAREQGVERGRGFMGVSITGDNRAMNILRELHSAEEELVGRAVD
jgi:hypothetical protein